jgi:hypothetical protein
MRGHARVGARVSVGGCVCVTRAGGGMEIRGTRCENEKWLSCDLCACAALALAFKVLCGRAGVRVFVRLRGRGGKTGGQAGGWYFQVTCITPSVNARQ